MIIDHVHRVDVTDWSICQNDIDECVVLGNYMLQYGNDVYRSTLSPQFLAHLILQSDVLLVQGVKPPTFSYFFLLFGFSPTFSYFEEKFLLFPTF